MSSGELNVVDHDRDSAGLTYVYPVVSRRAGGVSVGVNLNINNACNWRCVYCQVPNLQLGAAPAVDLMLLDKELRSFLHELLHGDFMQTRVPEGARRINDIALSGNGEPTSAKEFEQVVALIGQVMKDLALLEDIKLVLITNGSLMHRSNVQMALSKMAENRGEVWFKLDRASELGMQTINTTKRTLENVRTDLMTCIALCPTWLQTCWFELDGTPPSIQDEDDYLNFLAELLLNKLRPQGVLLYSLARPSLQIEAPRLGSLSSLQLELFAERIRALDITVKVSP